MNLAAYLEEFVRTMRREGGWGYYLGQGPQLEPSCFGLLALSLDPDRFRDEIARTWQFIESNARPDGSYRPVNGRHEAIWATSLVLFTEAALGIRDLGATITYLLGFRGCVHNAGESQDVQAGWSWVEDTFYWAEPTSWACLALSRAGEGHHRRVKEARQLLLDRAMEEGGVNQGSRRVLGYMTHPIPGPTALMILSLQGESHPRIKAAVKYLVQQTHTQDLDHLCWAKLALDCYRHLPDVAETVRGLDEKIRLAHVNRESTKWLSNDCYRSALMILALGVESRNFFRLPHAAPGVFETTETQRYSADVTEKSRGWVPPSKEAGFLRLLRTRPRESRALPATSAVHIARVRTYDEDLAGILERQYEHFRVAAPLRGKRVVIKPNLLEWRPDKVINTNPRVIAAVIELCKREGAADIIVAEGSGNWRNAGYLVTESGLGRALEEHGVQFVDINHDDAVKMRNAGQLTGLEYLYLSRTVAEADVVISVPKLKTHHWVGATLSLKNLFGVLPGKYYGWPKNELHWRGIHQSIVDIALTRTPELAIVDGIVGMEGDGPSNGTARNLAALVMGIDLVAVDATCCRLMMLTPEKITYLAFAGIANLGRMKEHEIPQLGEEIGSLAQPFLMPAHLAHLVRKIS